MKAVRVVIRCLGEGCGSAIGMSLPIPDGDQLALAVLKSGWAVVGRADEPGVIHIYCWPCAEKLFSPEILQEHKDVVDRIGGQTGAGVLS